MNRSTRSFLALSVALTQTACGGSGDNPASTSSSGWSLLGGGEEAAALLTLDVKKSERLARIHHDRSRSHETAVFEVVGEDGARLQRGTVVSPTVRAIESLSFLGEDQADYLAAAKVDEGFVLLRGDTERVDKSQVVVAIRDQVSFGPSGKESAIRVVVRDDEGKFRQAVLFWTTTDGFQLGPMTDRISDLEPTPDGQAAQYVLRDRRGKAYGVNQRVFSKRPVWKQFSGGAAWAFLGERKDGDTVFISHEPGETYASIRDFHVAPDGQTLLYQGKKGKAWTVVAESRDGNATPTTTAGPFRDLPKRLQHHDQSAHWFTTAKTSDGTVLAMGTDSNGVSQTQAFKRITLARFQTATVPVAQAESAEGKHVLLGTEVSPAYKKIDKLTLADTNSSIAYIGSDDAGQRVVLGTQAGTAYDKVSNYLLTTPSQRPAYVGTSGEQAVVVHEGKTSAPVDKVGFLKARTQDRVYWKASQGEGELVGLDATGGKVYDKVVDLETTPLLRTSRKGPADPNSKQTLWYDARSGDALHRVIETDESPAYAALGPVAVTSRSQELVYTARTSSFTEAAPEEEDKVKKKGVVKLTDVVVRNLEVQATYQRSLPGDAKGKAFLGDSRKGLPGLRTIAGTDHAYYTADSDEGTHVGFDDRSDGPFVAVKELKPRPDGSDVAYFAQRGEQWAVQEGAVRGEELDSVGKLRFTPDDKQVYYTGKRDKTSHTFVGGERWLKVESMTLTPRGGTLLYRGQRDDGWRLVVGGEASDPFAKLGRPRFTDDDHGTYVSATRSDKSQALLLKRHGKPFVAEGSWSSVAGLTEYHNTLARGTLVLDSGTGNYDLLDDGGNPIDLSRLPSRDQVPTFLGLGKDPQRIEAGWLVEGVVEGQLKLVGSPSERDLRGQRGRFGRRASIQPLHSPYAYAATNGKRPGMVYAGQHYTRWKPQLFTANNRFHALGTDKQGEYLVLGEERTAPFADIRELVFHPAAPQNDAVAIVARNAASQWEVALSDATAAVTPLGTADSLEDYTWTNPHVDSEANTLVWSGRNGGEHFEAVHDQFYDKVRGVVVNPTSADLSYVGYRNDLQSVFARGEHGPWYSDVRLYAVDAESGAVGYAGDHVYASSADPISITGPKLRKLCRVHINDAQGPFVDDVSHLYVGSSLETSTWTGNLKGTWSLYTGSDTISDAYLDLGWLHQTRSEEGDPSYHFLGRTADTWVEVHDGRTGTSVDAIVIRADWEINGLPPGHLAVPRRQGESTSGPAVFVDPEGRFDYRALSGAQEVLVRAGKPLAPVGTIGETWYFGSGDRIAYVGTEENGEERLVVGSTASPAYESVTVLGYWPSGDKVFAMARLPEEPETEDTTACANEAEALPFQPTHALLTDAAENLKVADVVASADAATVASSGFGALVKTADGWQAWVNGALGPTFDEPRSPGPLWGETLADSRYVGAVDEQARVFSDKPLGDAVDEVLSLARAADASDRYRYNNDHFVYRTRTGHLEQQWVADQKVAEGESVVPAVYEYDRELVHGLVDANAPESMVGTQVFSLIDVEAFGGAAVLGLTTADHTVLDAGTVQTPERTVYWDVQLNPVPVEDPDEPTQYELAWVGGVLDRDKAEVAVYVESEVFTARDGQLEQLRDLTVPAVAASDE